MLAYAQDSDEKGNELDSIIDKITDLIWEQKKALIRCAIARTFGGAEKRGGIGV